MEDRRDAWWLRGPTGWLVAAVAVAVPAVFESLVLARFEGAVVPWFHLGVAAGLVLWGGTRLIPAAVTGSAAGALAGWLVTGVSPSSSIPPGAPPTLLLLTPLTDTIGLIAMLAVMGRARRVLIGGRVELDSALQFVGLGMPAAAMPGMALAIGIVTTLGHPLDHAIPQALAAGIGGVFAAAPMVISLLPTRTHRTAYRCHCHTLMIPMFAMSLLIPIGLMPLVIGTDPLRTVAVSSVLAVGVLGWLSIASGWMATSGGILIVTVTTTLAVLKNQSPGDALHGSEVVALIPAAFIGLLFASTMEARFRDQHALGEQHDELRTLVDATGVAIIRTDIDGRIVHANQAGVALGVAGARFGDSIEDWFAGSTGRRLHRGIRRGLDGRSGEFELTIESAGRSRAHHAVCSSLTDDRGNLRGVSVVLVDMRLRERRERDVRRRHFLQTRSVASALVHDINNLAMAIGGTASLARESSDDTAVGGVLAVIEQQCEDASRRSVRMRHLATDAITEGRAIDVSSTVRDRLRSVAGTRNISIESLDVESDLPAVIDPTIAEFIVDEFVQNAIDAASDGTPSISLTVRTADDDLHTLELTLQDDGPGIPSDLHPDLGRRMVSTKGHGRGFGLRAIFEGVRQAGGSTTVATSAAGTTLTVRLPLVCGSLESTRTVTPVQRHPVLRSH